MIEANRLSKHYKLKDSVVKAVDNADFNIMKGEYVVIVGRSGSGKSTLLNLIAGLTKPTSGNVMIQGRDIWKMDDSKQSRLRTIDIGFVFQFMSLLPTLNTIENVMYPRIFNRTKTNVRHKALELLDKVGLNGKTDIFPQHLSVGQQKRVALARALINDPKILLADEPTSELDVKTENEITQLLKAIHSEGLTMIMVTHNIELTRDSDRTFKMMNGVVEEETGQIDISSI